MYSVVGVQLRDLQPTVSLKMINTTTDINMTPSAFSCLLSRQCDDPEGLQAYACFVNRIHGYLILVLGCFGVPTNIVNIAILTHKSMRSPVNNILTGIAISDLITMVMSIPLGVHFYITNSLDITVDKYTYGWTLFLAFYAMVTITTQTVSIWLGVCMAFFRYVYIKSMGSGRHNIDTKKSCFLVLVMFLLVIVIYIPVYSFVSIKSMTCFNDVENYTVSYYRMQPTMTNDKPSLTHAYSMWTYVVIGKLIPCFLIALFGGCLLYSLQENTRRAIHLNGAHATSRLRQHRRTTAMLLIIIVMYIIASLPQSILLIIGFVDKTFFENEYAFLGDTIDIISLFNNSINFVLYCAMSRQFRDLLKQYVCQYFVIPQQDAKSTQTASHLISQNNLHSKVYVMNGIRKQESPLLDRNI
ncbi:G-protein coupled receptor dmsr-1-like isoform X1 [Ostrea edulis]|uniref:G-protein coupled receptor dmsr-1-like isoform X1 n=2 Tax=Ostrea edulis TaxID=37623 RepID=UPI0020965045|nr:G-protein coupled receptor dmsr-1-like isoform X1 [Ostrea edulis]